MRQRITEGQKLRQRMHRDLSPELIGKVGGQGFYRIVLGHGPAVPYMFWARSPEDAIEQLAQNIEAISASLKNHRG